MGDRIGPRLGQVSDKLLDDLGGIADRVVVILHDAGVGIYEHQRPDAFWVTGGQE